MASIPLAVRAAACEKPNAALGSLNIDQAHSIPSADRPAKAKSAAQCPCTSGFQAAPLGRNDLERVHVDLNGAAKRHVVGGDGA